MRTTQTVPEGLKEVYDEFDSHAWGQKCLDLSGLSRNKLDVISRMEHYFELSTPDWSIDSNANVGDTKSPGNFAAEIVKGFQILVGYSVLYELLEKSYGKRVAKDSISKLLKGNVYFHDLSGAGVGAPYCYAATLMPIVLQGRPYGQLKSVPPKRSDSFMAQATEYVMDLSQDFIGAVAAGDLLYCYSVYLSHELGKTWNEKIEKQVENTIQKFIHVVNNKFRVGAQSAFTNISVFDKFHLEHLFGDVTVPLCGKTIKFKDVLPVVTKVQEVYIRFMAKKDPSTGLPYRFPISTANISLEKGEIKDKEFLRLITKYNTEGLFNLYVTEGTAKVASCCRLLSDSSELTGLAGLDSFGNGGINLGSTRVCTINLPGAAFRSGGSWKNFLKELDDSVSVAHRLLLSHRKLLESLVEKGYLKFFKPLGWATLGRFFCTFGIIGLYEALQILGIKDHTTKEWKGQAKEILKHIDSIVKTFSKEDRIPYNIEQVPAESAAITLARKDKIFFDHDFALYSNQSIPLWVDTPLMIRAELDGALNRYYSGGGISHLNIGSSVSQEQCEQLVRYAIKVGLEHFALNCVFSKCPKQHVTIGKSDVCQICGETIEDFMTRVVGYFTKISDWAKVRREFEFPRRKWGKAKDA